MQKFFGSFFKKEQKESASFLKKRSKKLLFIRASVYWAIDWLDFLASPALLSSP
jgi:hypothetical protein